MHNKFASHMFFSNVKRQIRAIFFLAIIPICIFGIFAIGIARREMLHQAQSQLEADAIRVNSTLFDITTSVMTSTTSIIDSADCRSLFDQEYAVAQDSRLTYLNTNLSNYRSNTAAISSIAIYTDNTTIPKRSSILPLKDGYQKDSWYQALGGTNYTTWFCDSSLDRFNNTLYELTLVQRLPLSSGNYHAFLITKLDSNYIRNRLMTNDHLILSSIDEGKAFFSSNRSLIWTEMPFPGDFEHQIYQYTGHLTLENTDSLASIVTFLPYKTANRFYILVGDEQAYQDINHITILYLVILLFATLLPALIIFLFSSLFSQRIRKLKHAMHQASIGDYNIMEQFQGDDELAETFQDLKTTVDLIHQKESAFYEAELAKQQLINRQQQMEFKMLASQINPHFLYNTLETIRMQAISCGNRSVADSIQLLGQSMHYVLENTGTDSTTLAKELRHIMTYLKIQQLRFGDRVNYEIQVPPYLDLERFRILPLLLQPIVENAVVHGLESITQNGLIEITLILEEPNLYITIHDNGEGMEKDVLEKLRHSISTPAKDGQRGSIGLRNINSRLCLVYGADYGLTIESEPSNGVTVTLTLPLDRVLNADDLEDTLCRREQYWNSDLEKE